MNLNNGHINQMTTTTISANNQTTTPSTPTSKTKPINSSTTGTSNYEGFANCITCGEYGVKAAFYGKSKLYCSVSCQTGVKKSQPIKRTFEVMSSSSSSSSSSTTTNTNNLPSDTTIAKLSKKLNAEQVLTVGTVAQTASQSLNTSALSVFIWTEYIENEKAEAAPVTAFKHCPLSNLANILKYDLKIEVPNREVPSENDGEVNYWFASVIKFAGYYAKLRYLGYEDNEKYDFWIHICDSEVHPVGWAAENDVSLVPPKELVEKIDDWKIYLIERLSGCNTLPKNFHRLVKNALKSPFKRGMLLELIDKKKLSRMKVSRIIDNIGGRLQMKYENEEFDDFWCHQESELIHPIGWSSTIGHEIDANDDYVKKSRDKVKSNSFESNECSPEMFKKQLLKLNSKQIGTFKELMKLEAIDPLNLSAICVATVSKILKNDYLMIRIDGYEASDMFCYHRNSSSIFPAGFCQVNNIPLQAPYDYKGEFSWEKYLRETNSEFAPNELFYFDESLQNPFKVGMKLESVDLMEPKMICVATVAAVVNRLIRLNFDGWDSEYDQWVDCESCDIYPVGWCHLVNYSLEPPRKPNYDGQHVKKKFKKQSKRNSKGGK